jgi:imidazolonepropionase-like amidohydrolase
MFAGAAAAGCVAGRARGVTAGLSRPRPPFAWKPERGHSVFLKGAGVVDVKRGRILRERGILFRDGQIADIVATRDIDKVEAGRTFDCRGMFAMPGLINSHCHMLMPGAAMLGFDFIISVKRQALRNLEECATHGVTTVRDASGLPLLLDEASRSVDSLEILGPRVVSCGPGLVAPGGYPDFSRPLPAWLDRKYGSPCIYVTDADSARLAVRKAVDQGARFIKIFFDDRSFFFGRKPLNTMDDQTVLALIEEAHGLGRRVAVHQSQLSGFRRAVRLGVDDLEHIPADGELEERDIDAFMKGGHNITPTASVGFALGIAPPGHPARSNLLVEQVQVARDQLLSRVMPSLTEEAVARSNLKMVRTYMECAPGARPKGGSLMFDNELFIEALERSSPNVSKLYEAGAKFCCGNDGGTPLSFPGYLVVEMEIMEWLGVSRRDILRSATINAAGLLDLEGELGSLEAGKLADILVLSANPLEDVRAVERVEAVFRSGILLHRGRRLPLESTPG